MLNDYNKVEFTQQEIIKGVDLEKEIDAELQKRWYGEYLDIDKFRESARHFFELGLKYRKKKQNDRIK